MTPSSYPRNSSNIQLQETNVEYQKFNSSTVSAFDPPSRAASTSSILLTTIASYKVLDCSFYCT